MHVIQKIGLIYYIYIFIALLCGLLLESKAGNFIVACYPVGSQIF